MPLQSTSGAASYDAFGGGVAAEPNYIESCFSTYLYTGTGASLPIVNGIDLSTEGGLVWTKSRSDSSFHKWYDSARGISFAIESNTTDANQTEVTGITSFNTNGYTYGTDGNTNSSGTNYASWTFRKQPKFFDIVTYTGDGNSNRAVNHDLGSIPGCILLKRTDSATSWFVYHRSTGGTTQDNILQLNTTDALATSAGYWGTTAFTDTQFRVSSFGGFNASGGTYVAYLFAHNAGGFGLTGTDNVISCGTFTADGSGNATVNLGYEPQFVITKCVGTSQDWTISDIMRGATASGSTRYLYPNLSSAEASTFAIAPRATGFYASDSFIASQAYIYIAIRRGPMKVPTSGTSVFKPISRTGTGANATIASGFTTDLQIVKSTSQPYNNAWFDRLRGTGIALFSDSTVADQNYGAVLNFQSNTAVNISSETLINQSGQTFANFSFQRAPSFFDVVCYTGTGVARTVTHNLTVVPELMIVKSRSIGGENWTVWNTTIAGLNSANFLWLNSTSNTVTNSGRFNSTAPTSSVFTVGSDTSTNGSGTTYVNYLFATLAGVSKVGSYTGTGTTLQINCGFTGGARFVMIKRTDSATADWYVWDSARGIIAGNDPYLLLNDTAAEVTNTDYVDTYSLGFEISSTAPAAINANGGSFIFLAIA